MFDSEHPETCLNWIRVNYSGILSLCWKIRKDSNVVTNPHTAGNTEHFGSLAQVMYQAYGCLEKAVENICSLSKWKQYD